MGSIQDGSKRPSRRVRRVYDALYGRDVFGHGDPVLCSGVRTKEKKAMGKGSEHHRRCYVVDAGAIRNSGLCLHVLVSL